MSTEPETLLVAPALREIWRPFYASAVFAVPFIVWAVIAFARGAEDAGGAAVGFVLASLLVALVRTPLWRLWPGRGTVTCDESAVHVKRGGTVVRHWPWSGVQMLGISAGDRWPEWQGWASFAYVEYSTGSWPHMKLVSSPGILLVRREQIERANRVLADAEERYAPHAVDVDQRSA